MKHNYHIPDNGEDSNLESPRINYISNKAKGIYANILLDDWFKRTFEELPSSKRLLTLLLQELIPERKIVDIKYAPQEHTNPNPDKHGICPRRSISSAWWTSRCMTTRTVSCIVIRSSRTTTARR